MCGICGSVGGARADRGVLARMAGTLAHRGPDDEGYYLDETAALGFRRLSIIDLETGNQPLENEDGSVHLVFNGEIYNFQELRGDLEGRGHKFATGSDGEVVVHLYEERGTGCLEALEGMFALALWDSRSQELFLARDRFGKKPL